MSNILIVVINCRVPFWFEENDQTWTERALSESEKRARSRFSLSDEREPLNLTKCELKLERRPTERLARTQTPSTSQQENHLIQT
ncbi:hypothetical protein GHT06_010847 [Daphnia sinensis]|uniref:Uncharacterized protein n=1 Tax=Daphnia sinensis TaxID=1820382 RepID=A0AAD5Q0T7_9CRUS|nr:hypothetical protein GHT06_010847 [Daphnia sinensis]